MTAMFRFTSNYPGDGASAAPACCTAAIASVVGLIGLSAMLSASVAQARAPACIKSPANSNEQMCVLYGDFDGDDTSEPVVYTSPVDQDIEQGQWLFDEAIAGEGQTLALFGGLEDSVPVVGRWAINCSSRSSQVPGHDLIGVYHLQSWLLSNQKVTNFAPGSTVTHDHAFFGGFSVAAPIIGDWNGDGIDTAGALRVFNGQLEIFFTDDVCTINSTYSIEITGADNDDLPQPVVGDWDGDGSDEVALFFARRGVVEYYDPDTGVQAQAPGVSEPATRAGPGAGGAGGHVALPRLNVPVTVAPEGALAAITVPGERANASQDQLGFVTACDAQTGEGASYTETVFPFFARTGCAVQESVFAGSQTIIVIVP